MKKIPLILTAMLVLASGSTFGQGSQNKDLPSTNNSNIGFYTGIRVIPHLTWMANKNDRVNYNYETLTMFGGGFGLAAGYNFDEHTGLELDVLYSLQGKRYRYSGTEFTQKLDYLKIPVMLTYTTKPATFMFLGKLGGQLSILTNASIDPVLENGGSGSDNKELFEDVVMGAVVSAGARYAINNNLWLDAALRFDATLTDVENTAHKYFPSDRPQTFNMTAGIELGLNYRINAK